MCCCVLKINAALQTQTDLKKNKFFVLWLWIVDSRGDKGDTTFRWNGTNYSVVFKYIIYIPPDIPGKANSSEN